jgi:hypothetical protein
VDKKQFFENKLHSNLFIDYFTIEHYVKKGPWDVEKRSVETKDRNCIFVNSISLKRKCN